MDGILQKTKEVLDKISTFESIKDYVMVGGTALSLQIKHRLSEDIDFFQWKKSKNQRLSVNCSHIEKELATIGEFEKIIIEFNQVDYTVDGIKITFFCDNQLKQPEDLKTIIYKNNVRLADINSIGAMKLEVALHRSLFRDYYDFFSIIKAGGDFNTIVDCALKYSKYRLRTREIVSMLSNSSRFYNDVNIEHLYPQYKIKAQEIEDFLIPYIKRYTELKGKETLLYKEQDTK